jgi:HSP20 family protein
MASLLRQQRNNGGLYRPFDGFLNNGFMDLFNQESQLTVPSVNIRENNESYMIDMAVPGMKKEDFNIDVDRNVMTISCEKETENKSGEEENYSRREYNYSSFSRSFTIPENANAEKVSAKYADGMLQLTIPKDGENKKKGKKIKVD